MNVSHCHTEFRSLLYSNSSGFSTSFKFSNSYNNTADNSECLYVGSLNCFTNLFCISFVNCKIEGDGSLFHFETQATFIKCSFVECASKQYFEGSIVLSYCSVDNPSIFNNQKTKCLTDVIETYSTQKIPFLNTYVCEGKFKTKKIKTCESHRHKIFQFFHLYALFFIP